MAGFISEWWPESNRNGGRHQIGTVADIKSESPAGLRRNSQLGAQAQLVSSLHLAAAALLILGRTDEAKTYSDEGDTLSRREGISHFDVANQIRTLFETFDLDLAGRLETDARASGNWEIVSAVVVVRATSDPSLTPERRLGILEGLLSELDGLHAPSRIREPARRAMAELLTKMGNPERAVGWWRDLAQDRPWDDSILVTLLNCYMTLSRWAEAETLLRAQIGLRGERPGLLFFLGKVLLSNGRMSDAVTALHKAFRLAEEGSDLKRNIVELRDKAMDAGGTVLPDEQPVQAREVSRAELQAALDEFALHIASDQRMSFWRTKGGKRDWVESPERLAKDQLHTFLRAKFGDRIAIFAEIAAGAGRTRSLSSTLRRFERDS